MLAAKAIFFASLFFLLYVYAIYPIMIYLLSRLRDNRVPPDESYLPGVSLIIAAYNEEDVIEEKILNSLSLDYPKEKLEIIIASDGSEDRTNSIVEKYSDRGVVLSRVYPRGGKARALNLTIPKAKHEVLVLSDANAMYQKDGIRQLVKFMKDPSVGGVTGDVKILNDRPEFGESEGFYYKYERFIQQCENNFSSIIGVDGAMYALKKKAFLPPSNDVILDDFVISMNIIRRGYRVLYNPEAVAYEDSIPEISQEIRRRIRITAGAVQALVKKEGLPGYHQIEEWFMYLSHKLFRWLSPFFMILLFMANTFLLQNTYWRIFFALQLVFCALAGLGWIFSKRDINKIFKVPFYFCMVNYAALVGFFKGIFKLQRSTWDKASREVVTLPENQR
jgi:biofilm PGA synthesis N-glycosyltransferase PgaC